MKILVRTLTAGAVAAALVTAAGCSQQEEDPKAPAVEQISYLTSFGNFGRDAYVWVAKEKGYFKDAGFEVDINPGKGSAANIEMVATGKAHFVPMDLSGFLLQKSGGKAEGVVAVAAIQQRTLSGIMTLEDKGITSPKDLENKKLADSPSSTVRLLFPTYARLAGIDATKVQWVNGDPATLVNTLASGSVDGIGQFVVGKPTVEAAAKGKKAVVLPYSDVMTDLMGNVLLTSTKLVQEKPDLVKRFTEALLKGLEYSIDHPQEAGEILAKYVPTSEAASAAAELELMGPYVRSTSAGVAIGALETERVARNIAILKAAGAIKEDLTPEQVIALELQSES